MTNSACIKESLQATELPGEQHQGRCRSPSDMMATCLVGLLASGLLADETIPIVHMP